MILAATGHRPAKLGGYGADVYARLVNLAHAYLSLCAEPQSVVSGMALGWDMAWAEGALLAGVPFTAAVPFHGQERMWPPRSRMKYQELIGRAARVVVTSTGGYSADKMQVRNEWMVDHADCVIALWDGTSGGTANCVRYAKRVGKPVENLWPSWVAR